MRGNAAILKCTIPSFVADFVSVVAWIDEDGLEYIPSDKNFSSGKDLPSIFLQQSLPNFLVFLFDDNLHYY